MWEDMAEVMLRGFKASRAKAGTAIPAIPRMSSKTAARIASNVETMGMGRAERFFHPMIHGRIGMKAPAGLRKAASSMSRHPYVTAGAIGAFAGVQGISSRVTPKSGRNVSAMDQNNIALRGIRARSSGVDGLMGRSSGGYTGM